MIAPNTTSLLLCLAFVLNGGGEIKQEEDQKPTYLQVIQTQLKEKHIQTLEDAMIACMEA